MATTRREVFMVESAEAAVALREKRVAAMAQADAITRYKEQLFLAIALYSRGDALEEVRAAVKVAVSHLENDSASPKAKFNFSDHDQYFAALWGLSLSILFGDPSMEFVQRGVGQDRVFDAFLRYTGAMVSPVQNLIRPGHESLLEAAVSPAASGSAIATFLRNWYAGMAQTSWHDTHIAHDPQFFGYWAFELAVVVKALNITDSAFSANIFYPRDLVHQRLFRTWLEGKTGDEERKEQAISGLGDVLGNLKGLLMAFFDEKQGEGAGQVNDGLKLLSGLLGTNPEAVKENPELLRLAMVGLVKGMMRLSTEALAASKDGGSPQGKKVLDAFKELQGKIQPQDGDLAEANRILSELSPWRDGRTGHEIGCGIPTQCSESSISGHRQGRAGQPHAAFRGDGPPDSGVRNAVWDRAAQALRRLRKHEKGCREGPRRSQQEKYDRRRLRLELDLEEIRRREST
ncbi:MAG: DUF1911 domain-containing protein [Bacteroidia bacterium]